MFSVGGTAAFPAHHANRQKVFDQFERYLDIASAVGAELGFTPQLHYFFVAGITQGQIDKMQELAREFNEKLPELTTRSPVELFVSGKYNP